MKDTIDNLKVFSEGLARNTGKLDGIVARPRTDDRGHQPAAERSPMISARRRIRDSAAKVINVQWAIPEPTAVAMLDTQRFLVAGTGIPGSGGGECGRFPLPN